ncbi:hypothetical protein LCGC14_0843040 [marine sediment metagenome]|uniref:Scaffolding protein n=1 Tax=marine sediment metagenome TaxID=412755 RepID=A0A0F9RX70_9ZZZZ
MPDVKTDNDEKKTADVDEENLSSTLKVDEEEATSEKKDEEKGEDKGDEEKSEETVEVPELSDEQIAALADDPRIVEARKGKEGPAPSALDELLKGAVADADQKRESEETTKKDLATREEALKAFRDDGDPAPLAALAARAIEGAERQQAVDAAAEEGVNARMAGVIQAVYGDTLKAMKPEEVKALDDIPLVDAIQKLADLKAAGPKAESDAAVSAAEQAARNAATGNSAKGDKVGVLPGGTAEEGAEGDDIGALLRKGIEGALDIEE